MAFRAVCRIWGWAEPVRVPITRGPFVGRLVKLQDIDQFSEIVSVPEALVTTEVLEGIRDLDERRELEPLIRQLLWDPSETPHGPTEIADVLTTKVCLRGARQLAAFVLKGRSFQKVRSSHIAHQILRLRQLPDLGFMALIATGHIQDDAQRDFIQVAIDAKCDYLIIDAVDLARLLIAYERVCSKDGTPFGDDGQCAHGHAQSTGVELTLRVRDGLEYDVVNLADVSHAGARRLSAKIIVNRNYGREALREVIRSATSRLASSSYHRSSIVERHWGGEKAHVVWLYLAGDLQDIRTYNWIARTQWIDGRLDPTMRPLDIDAREQVDDIGVVWNDAYRDMRKFYGEHTAEKGEILSLLKPLISRAEVVVEQLATWLDELEAAKISAADLTELIRSLSSEIDAIVGASGDLPFAPQDARDYDSRAQSLFGWLGNIALFHNDRGMELYSEKARVDLTRRTLRDCQADLDRLRFEREKLHRDG